MLDPPSCSALAIRCVPIDVLLLILGPCFLSTPFWSLVVYNLDPPRFLSCFIRIFVWYVHHFGWICQLNTTLGRFEDLLIDFISKLLVFWIWLWFTLVTKLYTQVQWEQRSGAMGFGIGIHKPDNKVTGGSGAENGGNWRSCHSSLPPAGWPLCAGPPGVWGVPCWTHQPLPPWGSRYPQLLYTMLEGLYPYLLSSMTIVFLDPKSIPNKWPFVLKIFTQRPNLWTFFVTAVWRLTGVHLLPCLHVGGAFLCFWKLALWVCSLE